MGFFPYALSISMHLCTNMCVFQSQSVVGRAGCSPSRYDSLWGKFWSFWGGRGGILYYFKEMSCQQVIIDAN